GVLAVTQSGQDPPDRIRPLCSRKTRLAWARKAGNLQLPRLYLHLRTQQPWAVPREEDYTARSHAGDAQGDQGGAATANASSNPRARGLDQAGGQRLLRLPCSADQRRCAESILLLCEAHLAARAASAEPEGSLLVAADAQPGRRLDSSTANPSSVSSQAFRRHTPKVGAVCGNPARTDLGGGRSAMTVPTALH